MEQKTFKTLEFNKILKMLADFAQNTEAKALAENLLPSSDLRTVLQSLSETDSAVSIILKHGSLNFTRIFDVSSSMKRLSLGGGLSASELLNIASILKGARIMKQYTPEQAGTLSGYIEGLVPDKRLEDKIVSSIISEDEISDNASPELASIRRKMKNASEKVRSLLDSMIHSQYYKPLLQDAIVTVRNNRYVVPVKAEHRSEVKGITHDMSATGSTVFIEPEGVVNANNALHELSIKEKAEIERILLNLSNEVSEIKDSISYDHDTLIHLDFVFAKAKFSLDTKSVMPKISDGKIIIKQGRHPLIDRKKVVPVDISLGDGYDTLIVTGPNTGGKTVVLKTIGLFCLMAQAGLHLPAADNTEVPICSDIFSDIGDEQSIEQNLSTFSSHMKNIVEISKKAGPNSLLLFDELGAGTDPIEGAALATAIIESFRKQNNLIAATTHYSELKLYALSTDGVENASCEFNVETLSPTYRLITGIPGKSNAFAISEKLGLPNDIIDNAKSLLSKENIKFEDVLSQIEDNRLSAEKNFAEAERLKNEVELLKKELSKERDKIEKQKDKIFDKARERAEKIIVRTQDDIDKMYDDIKKAQKEHDNIETLRQIQELKKELGLKLQKNVSPKAKKKSVKKGNVNLSTLMPGASVIINDLGDEGSVLSINKKENTVVVQVGIMKITANADNLSYALDTENDTKKHEVRSASGSRLKTDSVKSEIDLRGMTLEEAENAVDKFLDDCALSGLNTVSIIHGKGTGTLRSGIHAMLLHHPHVKKFRLGKYGEGENGVTIAELK